VAPPTGPARGQTTAHDARRGSLVLPARAARCGGWAWHPGASTARAGSAKSVARLEL